jgi:Leucine-rich repeat (LRR) protein
MYYDDDKEYKLNNLEDIYNIQNPENVEILHLNLYLHKIIDLNVDILNKLTQVKQILLYNCTINNLNKNIFKYNTQLQELKLNYNNITNLDKDIFANLTQLTVLNISYNNNLTELDKDIFKYNTQLQELSIRSNNKLKNLNKDIFKYNTQLQELSIKSNNNFTELGKDIFKYNTQLQELHLSDNNITNLDKDIFSNLTQLRILSLSYNDFTELDKESFKYNTQLQELYLYNNNITNLDKDIFKYNTQLRILFLSNNNITNLDKDIFSNLTQLEYLYLYSNNLTTIPTSILLCRNIINFIYHDNEFDYIPPNIQNFLNRIKQQSEQLQVYNDSQNVHNHQIQECIKVSLENILNIPKTINKEQLLDDIITSEVMNKKSIQLLLEYCQDKSIHSILNINFEDALLHVLEYINLECSENKEEIYKILADEIVESECKCFSGRISRLINCLNGFTPLVEVKIPENMEISNVIVMIKNNYNGDNVDELKELVRKELLERCYEDEIITEYVDYIEI